MRRIAPCMFIGVFICFVVFNKANGQYNLIPNPSFEVFDTCPNNGGQLYHSINWINPLMNSTPDYLNACNMAFWGVPSNIYGNEWAHTGVAYSAIVTAAHAINPLTNNAREYLETELLDTLIQGTDYCIRFYVSAADSMKYVSNNIGVYFSSTLIQDTCWPCNLQYLPQFENPINNNLNVRNGWTEVAGSYTAVGGEKYIIIGNFRDSNLTTTSATGWTVDPLKFNYALYYIDDVLITPCDSLTGLESLLANSCFQIFSNQMGNYYFIKSKIAIMENVEIYDLEGKIIFKKNGNCEEIAIDLQNQAKGIYIARVFTKKDSFIFKLIKK